MKTDKDITVVFLMWLPYGYERFRLFLESYHKHAASIEHQLVIAFVDSNGNKEDLTPYHDLLATLNISHQLMHLQGGLDIDTYFFAARQLKTDLLFFLNTYSVILADDWLLKMYRNILKDKTGMAAATGSWQSYRSSMFYLYPWRYESSKGFVYNFRKYKLLIKAAFYYPLFFKSFPNPHLRTNGFMIWRTLFLTIQCKPLTSKFKAYGFESGRNSISRQLLKAGYNILLVDKHGQSYEIAQWNKSRIFWRHQQEDLLISDNQTEKYNNAGVLEKKMYNHLAWGKDE